MYTITIHVGNEIIIAEYDASRDDERSRRQVTDWLEFGPRTTLCLLNEELNG